MSLATCFRLLTPALSSFGEERENYFVGRFTQSGTAFAPGYYLSLRWSFELMNTKDFLRLGVPLGQATRLATDFISRFILGSGATGARTSVRFNARSRESKRPERRAPFARIGVCV